MNQNDVGRNRILDLIANDSSGLLAVNTSLQKSQSSGTSIADRNIQEIIDFVSENGRLPKENLDSVLEFQLSARLEHTKSNSDFDQILERIDTNKILKNAILENAKEPELGELSDRFNLLSNEESKSIFNLVHVKSNSKLNPIYMSHRVRCLNFFDYEPLFNNIHSELSNKTRRLIEFNPDKLDEGSFFVLSGVLGYFAKAQVKESKNGFISGDRMRTDGRTHCIFDNGTESRMLYRSLVKGLQSDGFLISDPKADTTQTLSIAEGDQSLGYIYVLQTLNPKLKDYVDLYKIGFTSGVVSSRIANCEKEATYLFSRVRVAATYRCYNINASTVEDQLHKTFETTRLDFELRDSQGNTFRPREWFQVQIGDIEFAIELIQTNELTSYSYDSKYGFVQKSID